MVLLLFSPITYAENIVLKYGLGMGATKQLNLSDIKYISAGYEHELGVLFKSKFDLGYWNDIGVSDLQRNSSGFTSASIGVRVAPNYFYIENFFGCAWVFSPDTQLGLPFEFTEEFGFGLEDQLGKFIGFEYRHFSNAGLSVNNKGRDFILINMGVPL